MSDAAAFRATYSNWRVVRGRGVIQITLEIPIENEKAAYDALGGMPQTNDTWVAVARLTDETTAPES